MWSNEIQLDTKARVQLLTGPAPLEEDGTEQDTTDGKSTIHFSPAMFKKCPFLQSLGDFSQTENTAGRPVERRWKYSACHLE
jgi:hypothetical protein